MAHANKMCTTNQFVFTTCSDGSMKSTDNFGNTTETGTDAYGNPYVEMCSTNIFGNTTCTR